MLIANQGISRHLITKFCGTVHSTGSGVAEAMWEMNRCELYKVLGKYRGLGGDIVS